MPDLCKLTIACVIITKAKITGGTGLSIKYDIVYLILWTLCKSFQKKTLLSNKFVMMNFNGHWKSWQQFIMASGRTSILMVTDHFIPGNSLKILMSCKFLLVS